MLLCGIPSHAGLKGAGGLLNQNWKLAKEV